MWNKKNIIWTGVVENEIGQSDQYKVVAAWLIYVVVSSYDTGGDG